MAGSYPDMPSRRMAYDADQTVHYVSDATNNHDGSDAGLGGLPSAVALVEATQMESEQLNNESNDAALSCFVGTFSGGGCFWFMFFPEPREIDGYYLNRAQAWDFHNAAKSTDTTNGIDGTWSALGSQVWANAIDVKPDYRNSPQTTSDSNIVALSVNICEAATTFTRQPELRCFHVYGTITPGGTPDRLLFLNTALSDTEYTKPLDYGNIGRGSLDIRTIKVRNNSGSLTANTVQITASDLEGGTPSGYLTFSTDGINDQGTLGLGNIAPGATVTVYVHLAIPDAAALDLHAPRIQVNQASWS